MTPNTAPPRRARRQGTTVAHPWMDRVFTPRAPCGKNMVPRHDTPSGETDALRPPPSCPPSSEDFRSILHPACRTLLAVARSPSPPSPLPEEAWRCPKHHLDITNTHQPALQPHHHGGARPASSTRRWELQPLAVARRGRSSPPLADHGRLRSGRRLPVVVGRARRRPVVASRGCRGSLPPPLPAPSVVAVPLTRDKHESDPPSGAPDPASTPPDLPPEAAVDAILDCRRAPSEMGRPRPP
ncbi:unnamed protein product [Urochloa humidicola]